MNQLDHDIQQLPADIYRLVIEHLLELLHIVGQEYANVDAVGAHSVIFIRLGPESVLSELAVALAQLLEELEDDERQLGSTPHRQRVGSV